MRISILAMFLAAGALCAQDAGKLPSFEVASLKPSRPEDKNVGIFTYRGGRITAENMKLSSLIEEAFSVQDFQIAGGPSWVRLDRFNLDARPPADSKSSQADPFSNKLPLNPEQRQMLQSLLIDRFQLKFHRETKEGSVYLLTKTNRTLKLQPVKDDHAFPWVGSPQGAGFSTTGVAGTNATMSILAARLSPYLRRPVLDHTGLPGAYDFRYDYVADDQQTDLVSAILTSVQALGLKLEPGKGPVETIVIDSVAKPTAN